MVRIFNKKDNIVRNVKSYDYFVSNVSNDNLVERVDYAYSSLLSYQKDLDKIGINYDLYFNENTKVLFDRISEKINATIMRVSNVRSIVVNGDDRVDTKKEFVIGLEESVKDISRAMNVLKKNTF